MVDKRSHWQQLINLFGNFAPYSNLVWTNYELSCLSDIFKEIENANQFTGSIVIFVQIHSLFATKYDISELGISMIKQDKYQAVSSENIKEVIGQLNQQGLTVIVYSSSGIWVHFPKPPHSSPLIDWD